MVKQFMKDVSRFYNLRRRGGGQVCKKLLKQDLKIYILLLCGGTEH